ncbi:MAG: hypothetical protein ABIW83_07470 [Allosphingosinicella sp.]
MVAHFAGRLGALIACALGATASDAACTAANTYNFAFAGQANATLNYANSYNYTASNTLGATQGFTVGFATNGLSSSQVSGLQMPSIGTTFTSGTGAKTLQIGGIFSGRTTTITSTTRVIRTTFTFATPIRDLTLTVHDIDYANNQYRDWLQVEGANGASTYAPSMITPFNTNNTTAGPHVATASSSVALGVYNGNGVNLTTADQAAGIGASNNTNTTVGDITISFVQPVTSVTLRYGNYPYGSGENTTGQQAFGISALSFCPLPNLTSSTKTSAPFATSGPDRFNAPLSDIVYTLTINNSGGSPVDLAGMTLVDALPANMTFYNSDFDPALPGTEPFFLTAGSSGVTLTAANVAYSNNGGASYAYTPATGYDANVNRIRISPGGTLAANSSFNIKFRARIK